MPPDDLWSPHHTKRWQQDGPYVTQTMRHATRYEKGKQLPEANNFNCQIHPRSVNFVRSVSFKSLLCLEISKNLCGRLSGLLVVFVVLSKPVFFVV